MHNFQLAFIGFSNRFYSFILRLLFAAAIRSSIIYFLLSKYITFSIRNHRNCHTERMLCIVDGFMVIGKHRAKRFLFVSYLLLWFRSFKPYMMKFIVTINSLHNPWIRVYYFPFFFLVQRQKRRIEKSVPEGSGWEFALKNVAAAIFDGKLF